MKKRILSMILALAMVLSLGLSVVAEGEETQADIVDAAFALEPGASLEGTKTLTGEVSYIVTAYNSKYENVTVNIHVLDGSGNTRTIQCYQMKGADAATVGVGDVITVTGTIKNYNGLVEFDKACTFVTESKAVGDYPIKTYVGYDNYDVTLVTRLASGETTLTDILYKFKNDKYRDWNYYGIIVVGADNVVTAVYSEYGTGYSKADVEVPEGGYIIGVNGKNGDDHTADWGVFDVVAVGSTIRLFGADLEAAANVTAANTAVTGVSYSVIPAFVAPTTEEEILAAAFALEPGTALPGGPYSLTGVVNKKTDNKTQVNITVGDKDVLCYQMNADDYAAIAVGDTVIVTGNLKNYNGVVEFDTGCTAEKVVVPEFDESLWEIFDPDTALWVDGVESGKFQGKDENAACGNAYSYVYAYDKENVYVAVQTNYAAIGTAESYGNGVGTNLRLWFRTNPEAVVYTHFVDISYDGDATPVIGAKKNGSLTANSGATAIATDGVEAEAVAGEGTVFIQAKIPFSVIEATADFGMFVTLSNGKSGEIVNNCIIHPYDADCTFDKEGVDPTQNNTYFPYTSWNSAAIVIEAAEPEPEPYEATVIVADNAILTDGETGFQGAWGTVGTGDVLLVSNPQCTTVPMIVTIIDELDEITEISKVILDLYHDANVMIGYPEGKAAVSVSADGETYTDIGEFDLVAADLGTGNHGTVSNVFEFEATEAKFVKIVLNVGSNAAVLGDSPADGKVNWEFISIAEITVEEAEELPEGATEITHFANYGTNVSSVFFRIGEAKTIGEVIEITYGTVKNFAWSNAMVVDADGKIIEIVPDGQDADKTNLEIPEGGFIITGHGSSAAYTTIAGALVGGTVELINVDEEALVNGAVAVALTNAAFVYTEPEVERPISYQKPYTVAKGDGEATYWSMWDNSITLEDDGVILTDGKKGSLNGPSHDYVAINGLADEGKYVKVVVDLGDTYFVDRFDTYTASNKGNASWGISEASFVRVKVSADGETFTEVGFNENGQTVYAGTGNDNVWNSYQSEIVLEKAVSARYVEFDVYNNGSFCWIEEVEVWEGEEPEPMGDTTIDGVFDDDIWADVEWTTYDGYTKGTWQQYHKKGTYTYKTAIAEDDDYIYFAGEVSCLDVTQIRLWFRTNPEASLYTHFVDVFSDGRNLIKKNQSLTENSGAELENKPVYALVELEGKTYVEIKVAKSDLDMDGDYDFIPQASVDGFSNLLGAEIIHGNFVYGGKPMTYFPWVTWPAAPEETYIGLIPVTNHWTFTDITSGDTVGVINKAHYERQEDGSLRFVVGGTALYPLVSYEYEEAKVYNVARGTLNYKFTTDRHNTNITFIFEDANGAPYGFPLANSAAGFAEGQYNAGTGDILPGTYEGSIALADLVASTSLYGNNPFPEADATELKFIGIQIYACGITDPAGGVYIDDLSVTEEAAPEVNENVKDLGEVVTITGVTFTADNPDGLETVEILGSIDGVNYYRLNSEPAVTVTDGVATVNFAMANNNFRAFLNIRYIKVVGAPNVEGEIDIIEAAEEDVVKGIAPQGPYTQTGLNTNGYGIVVWTAEDAPEGFGLNDKGVYTDHDKALNLNSCMITIAEEVDEGVYKILWNDSNGWSKETGAAHLNTPEGVEGVDYRDGKVYLGENQIAMFIMSSGGYNTAGDGEFSTAKWILRGIVEGGYLRFGDETVEFFNEQPAAAASQEELSIADFDQDGDIDSDDAIYLLRAVLFPEDYEITLATPFYGDRNPTSDDAIYLLRHVLFPKDYPIPKE